jgi:hypothetical protein
MCDDQEMTVRPASAGSDVSRRNFLHGTAAAAAAAAVLGQAPQRARLPLASPARPAAGDGTSAYSMAMHIHSSFSELYGSMEAQMFQAAANSVDVLWWTDHDHRMRGLGYRDQVHFTSLTQEQGGPGQGGAWHWRAMKHGPLASGSGGGIVTNPSSPNDPVIGGSMHLHAKSLTTASASYGFYADSTTAFTNYRDNLTGQSLSFDVLLKSGWTRGYLELLIVSSYHEASGGRPAGKYSLSYRLVPAGKASRVAQGNEGVITVPVQPASPGDWATITVAPFDDIAALWPDLDYRDFALYELFLYAVSTGDAVAGYFDYLRFHRTISGHASLKQQADMGAALAPKHPGVTQHQGLEVSWRLPHINWFGAGVQLPSYGEMTTSQWGPHLRDVIIPNIHSSGGLVSYNHPYGTAFKHLLPPKQQNAVLAQVARELLPSASSPAALGADILEVAYNLRVGMDLTHHVGLWDVMSRNAVFLTGSGTSDDHIAQDWATFTNNWITGAWAASTAQSDLLAAIVAGRAWCASLSGFARGALNLNVDGTCPMGSVSVSSLTSRKLTVTATGIPAGGSLHVLQGHVDYAGAASPVPDTKVIARFSQGSLAGAGGQKKLPVDTKQESFVRTAVLNAAGKVIGVSNPVWLLRKQPPAGIPAPRRV